MVALNNLGVTFNGLNRCDEALAKFDEALALQPDHAEAHFNRQPAPDDGRSARARAGAEYEWRWKQASWADRCAQFSAAAVARRRPLAGKTILLHAEQGFGDTLQFVRYAAAGRGRGARVVLEVQPPLKALAGRHRRA